MKKKATPQKKLICKKALVIVDVQNDFCPRGALAVPEGDTIITTLNKYIQLFSKNGFPIFVSRDWHPKKTKHFKAFGGMWPIHCVQNTKGAQFHPKLKLPKYAIILSKGMDPEKESYSVFEGFDDSGQPFYNLLTMFGIKELYVAGLATDYCVKASAIDAIKQGFSVRLLIDAVKGVDITPGDSARAIKEMVGWGVRKATIDSVFFTKRKMR